MKNTDVSWRRKIGSFGGGNRMIASNFVKILCLGSWSFRNVISVTLIGILLIISGVESNPGPMVSYFI